MYKRFFFIGFLRIFYGFDQPVCNELNKIVSILFVKFSLFLFKKFIQWHHFWRCSLEAVIEACYSNWIQRIKYLIPLFSSAKFLVSWSDLIFVCLYTQVSVLLWEGEPPNNCRCNPKPDRIDNNRDAEWHVHTGSHHRCFLCEHVTIHSVPETERRGSGREVWTH